MSSTLLNSYVLECMGGATFCGRVVVCVVCANALLHRTTSTTYYDLISFSSPLPHSLLCVFRASCPLRVSVAVLQMREREKELDENWLPAHASVLTSQALDTRMTLFCHPSSDKMTL